MRLEKGEISMGRGGRLCRRVRGGDGYVVYGVVVGRNIASV